MIHKSELCDGELKKLEEVFNLYMNHGIEYNKKMNNLYMKELEGMVKTEHKTEHKTEQEKKYNNTIIVEMENIIIANRDEMERHIII